MIRTVFWEDGKVKLIDQTQLPRAEEVLEFEDYHDVAEAIKTMKVRGAPAIGVTAALGIALGVRKSKARSNPELLKELEGICEAFIKTRPTAKNLFWATQRMKKKAYSLKGHELEKLKELLLEEALEIHEEDIAANKNIGKYGKDLIEDKDTVLTHCNAGALATAGYGTALGVIRKAVEGGKKIKVFATETRPFLQGARLTCWELCQENIPTTLITDSMAGFLMQQKKIDKVVVGADRIALNGDVANKIGTYTLAVLAKENGIPFYVAAPTSTIDFDLNSGKDIPIEERDPSEVTSFAGLRIAPHGVDVYNPAFDVTPAKYITAIVTEAGILAPPYLKSLEELRSRLRR